MASIKLVHHTHKLPVKIEYMYDGLIVAYDGVVEIPPQSQHWARPLYIKGYQYTTDGRWLQTQMDLESEVARQLSETSYSEDDPPGSFPRKPIQTATRVRAGTKKVQEPATV